MESKKSFWRIFLGNDKLDSANCLKGHYRFGFVLLGLGIYLTFALITGNNQKLPLPRDILLVITSTQIVVGLILSVGVFLKKSNPIIIDGLVKSRFFKMRHK
ncbi:MAG: hypothetical protein HQK67_00700 [Desulfamplus sp.]|nr:hypothetical protein [Desulfamplus sp.]